MGVIVVPPLVFPTNVPTYDVSETAHIQPIGPGFLKFWLAATAPIATGDRIVPHRVVKIALVIALDALPLMLRKTDAAMQSLRLLTPDDFMGEPHGHA